MSVVPSVPARPRGSTGTSHARRCINWWRSLRGARGSLLVDYGDGCYRCSTMLDVDHKH